MRPTSQRGRYPARIAQRPMETRRVSKGQHEISLAYASGYRQSSLVCKTSGGGVQSGQGRKSQIAFLPRAARLRIIPRLDPWRVAMRDSSPANFFR